MIREILLAALVALSPTLTQEPADARDLLYRAFYQEAALRSFAEAEALYARVLADEAAAADPGLAARAWMGRARCYLALGRRDEARRALEAVLQLAPDHAEARAALDELARPESEADVDEEIRAALTRLLAADPDQALKDLRLFGTRAVPVLAESLRAGNPAAVGLAARALVSLAVEGDPGAVDALGAAAGDPALVWWDPYWQAFQSLYLNGDTQRAWEQATQVEDPARRVAVLEHVWERLLLTWVRGWDATLASVERLGAGVAREVAALAARPEGASLLESLSPRNYAYTGERVTPAWLQESVVQLVRAHLASRDSAVRGAAVDVALRLCPVLAQVRSEVVAELERRPVPLDPWTQGWLEAVRPPECDPAVTRALATSSHRDLRLAGWRGLTRKDSGGEPLWPDPAEYRELTDRLRMQVLEDWTEREHEPARQSTRYGGGFDRWPVGDFRAAELPVAWRLVGPLAFAGSTERVNAARWYRAALASRYAELAREAGSEEEWLRSSLSELAEPGLQAGWVFALDGKGLLAGAPVTLAELSESADPLLRRAGYAGLEEWLAADAARVCGAPLSRLADDVLAGGGTAGRLLALLGDHPAPREVLRRLADASEDERGDALAAATAALGVEATAPAWAAAIAAQEKESEGQFSHAIAWLARSQRSFSLPETEWRALVELASARPVSFCTLVDLIDTDELAEGVRDEVVRRGLPLGPEALGYHAASLIYWAGAKAAPEELAPYLRSFDHDVRQAALQMLEIARQYQGYLASASFGTDARARAVRAIRENAAHADPARRRAAAYGVAALGDPDGVALLFDLLGDEDAGVRAAALESLERLGATRSAAEEGGK